MKLLSRFIDSNDRELRRIQPMVDEANALEAEYEALSDADIRAAFAEIRAWGRTVGGVAELDDRAVGSVADEPLPSRPDMKCRPLGDGVFDPRQDSDRLEAGVHELSGEDAGVAPPEREGRAAARLREPRDLARNTTPPNDAY